MVAGQSGGRSRAASGRGAEAKQKDSEHRHLAQAHRLVEFERDARVLRPRAASLPNCGRQSQEAGECWCAFEFGCLASCASSLAACWTLGSACLDTAHVEAGGSERPAGSEGACADHGWESKHGKPAEISIRSPPTERASPLSRRCYFHCCCIWPEFCCGGRARVVVPWPEWSHSSGPTRAAQVVADGAF